MVFSGLSDVFGIFSWGPEGQNGGRHPPRRRRQRKASQTRIRKNKSILTDTNLREHRPEQRLCFIGWVRYSGEGEETRRSKVGGAVRRWQRVGDGTMVVTDRERLCSSRGPYSSKVHVSRRCATFVNERAAIEDSCGPSASAAFGGDRLVPILGFERRAGKSLTRLLGLT